MLRLGGCPEIARCAECGVELPEGTECKELFYALLALESQIPGGPTSVAHFRAVAAYGLQNPRGMNYTVEAYEGLREALADCPSKTPVVWVQEEPVNMGVWRYLFARFGECLFDRWPFSAVCRPASASPATGWSSLHRMEQTQLMKAAFDVH